MAAAPRENGRRRDAARPWRAPPERLPPRRWRAAREPPPESNATVTPPSPRRAPRSGCRVGGQRSLRILYANAREADTTQEPRSARDLSWSEADPLRRPRLRDWRSRH